MNRGSTRLDDPLQAEGHVFRRAENGVWLADRVPPIYLVRVDG
jgi:RNA:NAD 2'-phosphotransferase (TPT1/KptA family)